MRRMRGLLAVGIAGALGCGGGETGGEARSEAGSRAPAEQVCDILTAADVEAATGTTVQRIDRNPSIGAGGTCVNFASGDGQAYLGVNRLTSSGEFQSAVGAVPADVYPAREAVPGLGEEAVLFKAEGGLRYLVARQGESGVVLFPLGAGFAMSDQQLRDLAAKALAAAQ
ncbi:MAG TPA: hypothetical protein VG500_13405 [Gemmatimonadales bacterium]|nr:hypothetical protein [Gemmatimonadales bacterium]